MITVIGRGHGGTRAMSHTLSASGFYMGAEINESGDLVPPDDMYEACRVMGRHVEHLGGLIWDFSKLHTMPIDPAFTRLIESYLHSVLDRPAENKGWKIPETTLVLPWIIRMFPQMDYVYWLRDPRDSILNAHQTDDLADFGISYEPTEDIFSRRAISWQYQYQMMRDTPSPVRRIDVRFEDFVLHQEETLRRLEKFVGQPLERIEVRPDSVGRWRNLTSPIDYDFWPRETLYSAEEKEQH